MIMRRGASIAPSSRGARGILTCRVIARTAQTGMEGRELSSVEMGPSSWGNGLFATKTVSSGEVVLSVSRESCLIISFEGDQRDDAIHVPSEGAWPRLSGGLDFEPALTWDFLLALALLDAISGDGGRLWESYTLNVCVFKPRSLVP